MSDANHVTKESFTVCKNTMLKEAQTSIALLLEEIQNHRFPKYPTQQKIIKPRNQIKFAANREVRRTRVVGENKEVTTETPSTKTADPTPVSMEKRRKGGAVAKKSLNKDALVPPSDVDSDQSHYSQSEWTCTI
jgi:hypothetical protein